MPIGCMVSPLRMTNAMVLLIGNYTADNQPSMHRFAMMMRDGLIAAGVEAELIHPQPFFGRFRYAGILSPSGWLMSISTFFFLGVSGRN